MKQVIKFLIIITAITFLTACASRRNEYGIPANQWGKVSKQEQDLIKQSNQPMTFNDMD